MRILACLILIFAVVGCTKKEPDVPAAPSPYSGTLEGYRNGVRWNAKVLSYVDTFAGLAGRWGISFQLFSRTGGGDSVLTQGLNLANLFYKEYIVSLDSVYRRAASQQPPGNALYANTSEFVVYDEVYGGDVVVPAPYQIVLTEPHYLEVSSYNSGSRQVSGRFALSLCRLGDTVRFTDCRFITTLPK